MSGVCVCSQLFLGSVSGVCVCSQLFLVIVSGVLSVHCYFLEA